MYDIYCKEFHKGRGDSLLEKKYQIHLQNHYDATSRQVQKKEIKVLKKHNNLLNGEVFPYQICLESTMEYSRFMLWFEKEVQKNRERTLESTFYYQTNIIPIAFPRNHSLFRAFKRF